MEVLSTHKKDSDARVVKRFRERFFEGLAIFVSRHPWGVIAAAAVATLFSTYVALTRARLSTDLTDVLPRDSREARIYTEVVERFSADVLFIALEADAPEVIQEAKPFFERLAVRLEALEDPVRQGRKFVRSVMYRSQDLLGRLKALAEERMYLFLDEEDISALRHKLSTEAISAQMAENRRRLEALGTDYFAARIRPDPLDLLEILQKKRARLAGQFISREEEDYLVSPDGLLCLMVVQAAEPVKDLAFDKRFIAAVEAAEGSTWDELEREEPERWKAIRSRVKLGHAGGYAVAVNENRILSRDISYSFVSSLLGVMVIFSLGFKRLRALLYIGVPLVASVLWTAAFAFLVFGHVSIMSGSFAAILVGLSVDYAIHVYNSYISARSRQLPEEAAMTEAFTGTGSGIFFSAITTAAAFFAIMLTRFKGLAEFGCLAGLGIMFGLLAMLFLLPAIVSVAEGARGGSACRLIPNFGLGHLADAISGRPWGFFASFLVAAVTASIYVYTTMTVYFFDSDFSSIRAPSEVYDLTERIQKKFGTNLGAVFALSRGSTEDEALSKAAEVLRRAEVLKAGRELASKVVSSSGESRPFLRVHGTPVRVRRAELVLPENFRGTLARGTDILTRPDGSRLAVYQFASRDELADWEIEGRGRIAIGLELEPGSQLRWRYALDDAVDVTFSVWFLGTAERIELGLAPSEVLYVGGSDSWRPKPDDQIRLSLVGDKSSGLRFLAGRGTIISVDSIAPFIPTRHAQESSARFVASIDIDRVASDIAEAARSSGFRPTAFNDFVERLRKLVSRASSPEYLTISGLMRGELAPLLSKYVHIEDTGEYAILTYLFPERGEFPREWFERVRAELQPAAEFTAPRLVSLEVRDIVYEDFPKITALAAAGVGAALLWSFRSIVWSLVALIPVISGTAMMLASMLLIGHNLNFINVLIFPIIVGIGIDYGIHVVHRHLDRAGVRAIITETGRAFLLTSLTTMMGFGSLMTSKYRGLWSFGFVSVLGMFFCLYASMVALPSLLALLERRAAGREKQS